MPIQSSWLRAPEAAKYLGVSLSTLAKWRTLGNGPRYSKLGRTVVYRESELENFCANRSVNSTSEDDDRARRMRLSLQRG